MELPIPKHLKDILFPVGNDNSELSVTGKIKCKCGSENFRIQIVGDDSQYNDSQVIKVAEISGKYFLIIKVVCNDCSSQHLIFDNDYHGWNGFVCGGDNRDVERPQTKQWNCDKCANEIHKMTVQINSQGKDDFMEEGGDEFGEENWVEGFDWITIEIECSNCNKTNPEWISYETM